MKKELVLCVHKNQLNKSLTDIPDEGFALISREFVESPELGTTFVQAIGCLLLIREDHKVFSYSRKGSEGRLTGKKSILIGGHTTLEDLTGDYKIIEKGDDKDTLYKTNPVWTAVMKACQRELEEETGIETEGLAHLGKVLYTTADEVSSVHVGYCFGWIAPMDKEIVPSEETNNYEWLTKEEILADIDSYEVWSQMAIDMIRSKAENAPAT
jgi:NUDIX domain